MAGYGHMGRGYTNYSGMEPESYAGRDHVCRPVIIDAEGRKKPIICYPQNHDNTENYVTKTQTIVEQVSVPPVTTDYKYGAPTKVELFRDKRYGYGRPLSSVLDGRPTQTIVEQVHVPPVTTDYKYGAPTKVELFRDKRYGYGRPLSPVHDRPQEVEEFITQVQTEIGRPNNRPAFLSAGSWRQPRKRDDYKIDTDYDRNDHHLKTPLAIKTDDHHYNRENWERPNHRGWVAPTTHPLSRPTNNIDEAVELLKEAAKSSLAAPPPRYAVPRDTYYNTGTIDSKEAARRFGNFNFSSRPYKTEEENYTETIDSREAMKKYNGSIVPP